MQSDPVALALRNRKEEAMTNTSLLNAANAAPSAATISVSLTGATYTASRPANWPTKRAFYANYFHTGHEANGVAI